LEALHPNIRVFRHPDHGLDVDDAKADLEAAFQNLSMGSLNAFKLSKAPEDAVKSLYGSAGEVVLYWAHHEKLCLVDRKLAFMGGLDMCEYLSISYRNLTISALS
jgi:phospholipase D1/2